MKKILLIILILNHLFAEEPTLQDFNSLPIIQEMNIKVISFTSIEGLYIIEAAKPTKKGEKGLTFFVSKDLKYTFFGRGYDNITAEKIYIKKSPLSFKEKVNFTYGSGKDEYYLFTDPECPFCKKFEKQLLKSDLKEKVTIYYFLYPLPIHKNAVAMSTYILSQKNKHKAVEDIMVRDSKEYTKTIAAEKTTQILETNKQIAERLSIRGTPKLLKPDGTRVTTKNFFRTYN